MFEDPYKFQPVPITSTWARDLTYIAIGVLLVAHVLRRWFFN